MVQTKKRSIQSSTLLDFFSGKSSTPNTKKAPPRVTPSTKRKAAPEPRATPRRRAQPSQDVIIISDDDEDFAGQSSPSKRIKAGPLGIDCDSDVELVEVDAVKSWTTPPNHFHKADAATPQHQNSTSDTNAQTQGIVENAPLWSPSVSYMEADDLSADVHSLQEPSEWGVPTLLMDLLNTTPTESSPTALPSLPGSSEPTLAEGSIMTNPSNPPSSLFTTSPVTDECLADLAAELQECIPPPMEESVIAMDTVPLGGDKLWETGDDETAFAAPAEEGVGRVENLEHESEDGAGEQASPVGESKVCPVCETIIGYVSSWVCLHFYTTQCQDAAHFLMVRIPGT